jgi:ABC-type polar amino acid transport system ATPase subunit
MQVCIFEGKKKSQESYAAVFQLYLEGRTVFNQFTLLTHSTPSNNVSGGQLVKGVKLSYVTRRAKRKRKKCGMERKPWHKAPNKSTVSMDFKPSS